MKIPFSYIATFISLIFGLGIAHGISCMAEYIQRYKKLTHYWIWWAWGTFVILFSINCWYSLFTLWINIKTWNVALFTFLSLESFIFYFMIRIFYDHYNELETKDLKKQYYKNKTSFYILMSLLFIMMFNISPIITLNLSLSQSIIHFPTIFIFMIITLAITNNHFVHTICTIIFILSYILLLILSPWIDKIF